MSGFYKILANKALDESLMRALKFREFFILRLRTKRAIMLSRCVRFITKRLEQILKFHERVISALKFELSGKRSQILVVNSC